MRIVFLDVDGVLNWSATWYKDWYEEKQEGFCHLDTSCCEVFQRVQKELNLVIVWSSTWRRHEILYDYLKRRGMWVNIHEDWRTPGILSYGNYRGHEIHYWLHRHPEISPTDYVIIDDMSDMLPYQKKRFVQTSFENGGFQEKHAQRVRELFALDTI